MSENPYDFTTDQDQQKVIQPDSSCDSLKINFLIKDGFGVETFNQKENGSNIKPRVLFHNPKDLFNLTSAKEKNDNLIYKSEQISERISFDKGRVNHSRQSSWDYYNNNSDLNQRLSGRRVNFKHKGSIDFSYSFLPGDVVSRK